MLVNAYILYRKSGAQNKKRAHIEFRQALVLALVESATDAPRPQKGGRRTAEALICLTERHFIGHIQPKPGAKKQKVARDCIVCNKKSKDREG